MSLRAQYNPNVIYFCFQFQVYEIKASTVSDKQNNNNKQQQSIMHGKSQYYASLQGDFFSGLRSSNT
eukprot:m.175296 g.175296  ORF g.175296 m.175296 type:complete len:67 (+) comp15422_c0_seq2:1137-1337(+)